MSGRCLKRFERISNCQRIRRRGSATLCRKGVVRQLQAGERFAYSPELLELARRVIERERTDPIVDVEEWARRMARQAAELRD